MQSHADVKVYYMNGNAQSVRIYSMENADSKNGEYSYSGQNINNFGVINATRFKLLTGVDFENATAADIAAIDAGTIQSANIKGKDELIGAVIALKTGSKSSARQRQSGSHETRFNRREDRHERQRPRIHLRGQTPQGVSEFSESGIPPEQFSGRGFRSLINQTD